MYLSAMTSWFVKSIHKYLLSASIFSLLIFNQILAYPRPEDLVYRNAPFYSRGLDGRSQQPSNYGYRFNVEDTPSDEKPWENKPNFQEMSADDGRLDSYNYDLDTDYWSKLNDGVYDNRLSRKNDWMSEEDTKDLNDREQQLLDLYYLVEALENQDGGRDLTVDSQKNEDLLNQLIEASDKHKDHSKEPKTVVTTTTTTSSPTTTDEPISKDKKDTDAKKGQKEFMMMRPATPIKHQFTKPLEEQLNYHNNVAKSKESHHWSSEDMSKLKKQLKKLKKHLKQ